MNKKNITKMFLLVTLIILLIGVVSAAEVSNNTDTSTTDTTNNIKTEDTVTNTVDNIDKSVTTKNTEKKLKTSTKTYDINDFNTLHNALTNNTYDTVNVNINSDIILNNNTTVNKAIKTLTINGNNNTINGNNTYQFIKIISGTITINNIQIINCFNENGGAIYNNGTLTITNTTLNNNTADYKRYGHGGAIYNKAKLTIINTTLNNNIAHSGYVLTTIVADENYTKLNSGRVSYTLDGKWIGSINVKNGSSWISFNVPTTGNHTLIANYIDTKGIQLGSDTFTFEKIANINVLFNAYNIKNNKVIIESTVKDDKGNNITNSRLSYTINYKWIGSINVKNGSSWISFNNTNNTIKFKATYINNNNITQTSYTRILNLNQLNNFINEKENTPEDQTLKNSSIHIMINSINVLNNKYVLTTKITDKNYTKLNTGRVSYTLNGKWIGSINVTNGTSWISFNIPIIGNHTIVATYIDTNGKAITTDTYSFEKIDNVNAVFNAYDDKNGKIIIVTTVKNDKSNPINTGRISYTVNNKWIGSINVKNGSSWISFNNTNNTITFKATYLTNDNIKQNIYTRTLDLNEIKRLKKAWKIV